MSWHKLVLRNDWENITVHIGGPVTGGRFGTNLSLDECPPVLESGTYRVRWPDGTIEELPVIMRGYTHTVSDMGHEYTVSGRRPYFVMKHKGTAVRTRAEELGVEVWREARTTKKA